MRADKLVPPLFRRDEQGREVFYPLGTLMKGRVVPDDVAKGRLMRCARGFYPPMIIAFLLIPVSGFLAAIPFVLILAAYAIRAGRMTRGYESLPAAPRVPPADRGDDPRRKAPVLLARLTGAALILAGIVLAALNADPAGAILTALAGFFLLLLARPPSSGED